MPNALGLLALPEAKPQPRNKLLGLLADVATQANQFATMNDPRYADKRQNQTLGLLADAVSLGSVAKTLDRLSYGDPLTNKGKANVPFLKPETADVAMLGAVSPRNALAALGMVGGMADNGAMRAATLWHGSPHTFDKVKVASESLNDMGMLGNVPTVRHGAFFSDNPKFASEYGNLSKWDVKPKKTAKITQELKDAFVESLDPFGNERDLWLKAKYGAKQDWTLFEGDLGKRFSDWLKASGYDAAKFKEYVPTASGGEVGGNTTVILNPETAKLLERLGPR